MSTPLDDEEQEPGLANGLFARGGLLNRHGLGAALNPPALPAKPTPSGYVTISHYARKGLNLAGHVGISVNGGPSYGLDPAWDILGPSLLPNPGIVEPIEPGRKVLDQIKVPATAEQAETIRKYLLDNTDPRIYNMEGKNCATFVSDALRSAGLQAPPYPFDILPSSLLHGLHQMYDGQAPAEPVDTRPTFSKY